MLLDADCTQNPGVILCLNIQLWDLMAISHYGKEKAHSSPECGRAVPEPDLTVGCAERAALLVAACPWFPTLLEYELHSLCLRQEREAMDLSLFFKERNLSHTLLRCL